MLTSAGELQVIFRLLGYIFAPSVREKLTLPLPIAIVSGLFRPPIAQQTQESVRHDASTLLPAVKAVLEGKRFVSANLAEHGLDGPPNQGTADHIHLEKVVTFTQPQNEQTTCHHEVGFYTNDGNFVDDVTLFIGSALKAGNAAIVVATESHRVSFLLELQAQGLDIDVAIDQGRYIPLDAADTLSVFMVNGMPDPVRFLELLGDLIVTATEAAKGEHPRVSVFGECVNLLCAQGKVEAAIQMEKLGNQLTQMHDVDILCGYSLGVVQEGMDDHIFRRICAEHSTVYSR